MNQAKLLLYIALFFYLPLSSFHLVEGNSFVSNRLKSPDYIVALDSLTNNYLSKKPPLHNRMWGLHKMLVNQLQKSGIDTVLFYQEGCVGCEYLPTPDELGRLTKSCRCAEEELVVYLFWQYEGKTLSKKLDCCQNQPVATENSALIDFYFQNKPHFQAAEKFFRDFEAYNRSHPKNVKFLPPTSIHDDVTHVLFYLGKKTVNFQVRGEEFTATGSPKHLRYQWKRKQWEWADLIKKAVATR